MPIDLRPLGDYGPFSAGTPEELAREIEFFPTHTWAHSNVHWKLCKAFGLETSGSMEGPQELSPRELLWAAERLSALVTGGPDAGRWLPIDDEILRGRKVFALREIRREFGLDLAEALELYEARRPTLREPRPFAFALMPREPAWDGDDSVTLDRLCALLLTSEDPDRFGPTYPLDRTEAHQPLDARTPRELAKQILALPDSPPELGALRVWLCRELGIRDKRRATVADVPTEVLVREAERLKAYVEALRQGPEAERWLALDDEILRSGRLQTVVAIRALFDGLDGELHLALSMAEIRKAELAGIRPWSCRLVSGNAG